MDAKLITALAGDGFTGITEVTEMTNYIAQYGIGLQFLNVLGVPAEKWFYGIGGPNANLHLYTNRTDFTEDVYDRIAVEASVMVYFTSTNSTSSSDLDCSLLQLFTGTTGTYGGISLDVVNGSLSVAATNGELTPTDGSGSLTIERDTVYTVTIRMRGRDISNNSERPSIYEIWINNDLIQKGTWYSSTSQDIRYMTGPTITTKVKGEAEGDFRYRNLMLWDGFTTDEGTPPLILRVTEYVSTGVTGTDHTAVGGTADSVITDNDDDTYLALDGANQNVELGSFGDVDSDIRTEDLRAVVSRTQMSRGLESTTDVSIRHLVEGSQQSVSIVKSVTAEHPTIQTIEAASTYDTTSTVKANDLSVRFVTVDNT